MTAKQIRTCGTVIKFNKRFKIGKVCEICGSTEHLTVHHKRSLSSLVNMKKKTARKIATNPCYCQILCSLCHAKIHGSKKVINKGNMEESNG